MKLLAIALGVTALCRADLITFASLPNAQYAATSPVPTPPGEIVFPGSEWLTPIAPGPQIYEQEFFIPFGFDIVGASIGIKTNGPTAASVNGIPLANVTDSTILDDLLDIHTGWNIFKTPVSPAMGLKIDVEQFVWYTVAPCPPDPPTTTPEPPTIALMFPVIAGAVLLRFGKRKR